MPKDLRAAILESLVCGEFLQLSAESLLDRGMPRNCAVTGATEVHAARGACEDQLAHEDGWLVDWIAVVG
jgi:hypothetical protein